MKKLMFFLGFASLFAACVQPVNDQVETSVEDIEVPFQYDPTLGYHGVLTLKGYLEVEERVCNPGDMCGDTVQYAWFVHAPIENRAFDQFYTEFAGNSFVGAEWLGIGCYQEDADRIYSKNAGDADGMVESLIEGKDLDMLLASDEAHPVDLKMTKAIFTGGSGAPDCYSHFRDFDVL